MDLKVVQAEPLIELLITVSELKTLVAALAMHHEGFHMYTAFTETLSDLEKK